MARTMVVEQREFGRVSGVLAGEGFEVQPIRSDPADPGAITGTVVEEIGSFGPDVVLFEVDDIQQHALDLCETVSKAHRVPIVVLCKQSTEGEVVAGYTAGVAMVLTEPVGSHELVARMRALLRRCETIADVPEDVVRVGPVVLDPACRRLTVDGRPVPLPRKEFDIAEMLIRGAGKLVTRRELLDRLWGGRTNESKSLDVQVGRLRARLALAEGQRRIVTVRGIGYRFMTDDDLARAAGGSAAPVHP